MSNRELKNVVLVIFGATGDLTSRKLVPAIRSLDALGVLPKSFKVIGVARSDYDDDSFRELLQERMSAHPEEKEGARFFQKIHYQKLDGTKLSCFEALKTRLQELSSSSDSPPVVLYYLAMSPKFFADIAENLSASGLSSPEASGFKATRLIVEKPFGEDLKSARELNARLRQYFEEDQIYRIDHYLGKETVQNILIFRFANGIFEPLWNRKYIDHIQISVCESIGVEGRAAYFDSSGILRDIVQNHLLQMLALLCIEPPLSIQDANSIRSEKVKVLRSLRRISIQDVPRMAVRAQYDAGKVAGESVVGYLEEQGVDPESQTETYVSMILGVENWRWAGVPIYVRAGKRLPKRVTEITVYFKRPPTALFRDSGFIPDWNVLAIQVQPHEGISFRMASKKPGHQLEIRPVEMDFTYGSAFNERSADAYERLLLDAMKGDPTLFIRDDEIEEAWDFLEPVMNSWASSTPPPVYRYSAGTWGPSESDDLLALDGHSWRSL